jgi:hypothetical protein
MNTENIIDPSTGLIVATIVSGRDDAPMKTEFVTKECHSIQVGVLHRPVGYVVEAHQHLPVQKQVSGCQEVLIVRQGSVVVDIFSHEKHPIATRVLRLGDIYIQYIGGHRFEFIHDSQIVEIKQGPYTPQDKVYFNPLEHEQTK